MNGELKHLLEYSDYDLSTMVFSTLFNLTLTTRTSNKTSLFFKISSKTSCVIVSCQPFHVVI